MKQLDEKYRIKRNVTFNIYEVIIITLALTILICGCFVFFYGKNSKAFTSKSGFNDIEKTYDDIMKNYYESVDEQALADAAVNGMLDYLDEKYSKYLNNTSSEILENSLSGEYQGIGVTVSQKDSDIVVVSVVDNSPAQKAGLKANDIITSINGDKIGGKINLNYMVDLIKKSKSVRLGILRDGSEKEYKIDVKAIEVDVVFSKLLESDNKKIGYIFIESFSTNTYKQFKSRLKELENENIDSLIIDVRDNLGGYVSVCTDILDLFMEKDSILYSLEEKNEYKNILDKTNENRTYPVVILVNEASASASEILTSSFKENYGAIIVGKKTYGKGKVQTTSKLKDNSMVKYTSARWLSPTGNIIDGIGIIPDISVDLDEEYYLNPGDDTDNQLHKAIEILEKQ